MPGHINISNPDRDEDLWRHRRELEAVKAELKTAYAERDHYRNNLASIFSRIEEGLEVELHYPHRRKIVVVAKPEPQP